MRRTGSLLALAAAAGAYAAWRSARRQHRFDGKRVVVTGGSRGLGLAIATEFARRGARIVLLAQNPHRLAVAQDLLRRTGADVAVRTCDVRNAPEVMRTIADIITTLGPIDVLVNNAGTIAVGPMETMTRNDYDDALATHFWGMYNTVQAAWKSLAATQGRIVNITSIGGRISVPHLLPYSVSKFAAVGYSEGLCAEAARYGIAVTTVTPGLMRTGSPRNAYFKGRSRAEYTWFMLSDTLPFISVAAGAAARRIVDACGRGEVNVDIGVPAAFASRIHGIAPGLVMRAVQLAAALLPRAETAQQSAVEGFRSETGVTQSPLTALGRKAERDFNQL